MYINTTPSLSLSHCACHCCLLLLLVLWWHSPCTLHHRGDGGGRPGSHHHPPPCHPHPPRRAGWWWWGRPCCCAPRLTHPPRCCPCRRLIVAPIAISLSPLSPSCHRAPPPCHYLIVVDVSPWHWPWASRRHCHHVDGEKGVVVGLPSLLSSLSLCPSSLPPHHRRHRRPRPSGGGGGAWLRGDGGG